MKQINMEKLLQYVAEGSILEFESDQACMEWFNTYDYQNFNTVEEMKIYQDRYGFNIEKKRYHILTDKSLNVYKKVLSDWTIKAKSEETGKIFEDKFPACSRVEAISSFNACYRHGIYTILEVTEGKPYTN